MNAFDANVLLYAVDRFDLEKQRQAVDLLERLVTEDTPPVLPWQVACEYLAGLRRRQDAGAIPSDEVDRLFYAVMTTYPLVCPTVRVLQNSRALFERYSLSHWDSLLLAACIDAGVDTLYSEDMSDGMTYDSVTVINPFKNP